MAGQTGVEGALPSCSTNSGRDAALRPPVGAARRPYLHFPRREIPVPVRTSSRACGIAVGLQALQRCSGLLYRFLSRTCSVPFFLRRFPAFCAPAPAGMPFRIPEREVDRAAQRFQKVTGVSRWKRPARGLIRCPHSSKHRAGAP